MPVSHRIEQMLDNQGQSVTIRKRTVGSVDEYNRPTYTWSDETTENAILASPTVRTFAEVAWIYAGKMEARDRLGYFKADSVIAENKRVVLQSGERYEVDVVDQPVIFGQQCLKVVILRRITEQ